MAHTLQLLVSLLAVGSAVAGPEVLTKSNFDAQVLTGARNAFVKFYAPWCGHCKAMAPDWNELGTEYQASNSVLIGDVDCTVEEELCAEMGVEGYPSLKYWDGDAPAEGTKYTSSRKLADLKQFVSENLEVKCTIADPEKCTQKEMQYMEKMSLRSPEDQQKELQRLKGMSGGQMFSEQRAWLKSRINMLQQLTTDQ